MEKLSEIELVDIDSVFSSNEVGNFKIRMSVLENVV